MTDSIENVSPITIGAFSVARKVSGGKSTGIRLALVVGVKLSRASTKAIVKPSQARGRQTAFEAIGRQQ